MTIKASTTTGSLERFIRTLVQIAIADSGSFPALVAAFHLSPTLAAKVIGIVNVIVLAVVAIQNGLESKGVIPAMLRAVPAAVAHPPLVALTPSPVAVPSLAVPAGAVDPTPAPPASGGVAS